MVEYKWYYVSESCEQARVTVRSIAKCGFNFVLFIVCLFIANRDERSSQHFYDVTSYREQYIIWTFLHSYMQKFSFHIRSKQEPVYSNLRLQCNRLFIIVFQVLAQFQSFAWEIKLNFRRNCKCYVVVEAVVIFENGTCPPRGR